MKKEKFSTELTQKKLKNLLTYDPDTGIFTWLDRPISMFDHCRNQDRACKAWNSRFAGTEAGCIKTKKESKTSYFNIGISINEKRKFYWAHRLVFLYMDGYFPPEDVDHIDGNGLNNCRNNLREVNALENSKNRPMQSNNTSGTVGVTWNKQKQKWQVQIEVNGRSIYGGRFINKSDAIAKRKEMEIAYSFHKNHGRNSRL